MFPFTAQLCLNVGDPNSCLFRRRSIWFKMPQAISVLPVASGHGRFTEKKCLLRNCAQCNAWGGVVDNDSDMI